MMGQWLRLGRIERKQKNNFAFTVVELLIVIAVIGILAGIVIVSYSGWKHNASVNQIKSDLSQAATAMESVKNFSSGYPTSTSGTNVSTFVTNYTASSGSVITWTSGDSTTYCLDGASTTDATIHLYITNSIASQGAQTGTCASH